MVQNFGHSPPTDMGLTWVGYYRDKDHCAVLYGWHLLNFLSLTKDLFNCLGNVSNYCVQNLVGSLWFSFLLVLNSNVCLMFSPFLYTFFFFLLLLTCIALNLIWEICHLGGWSCPLSYELFHLSINILLLICEFWGRGLLMSIFHINIYFFISYATFYFLSGN